MASACVTFKANTHLANSEKGDFFRQENGFLGERIKGSLNSSPWIINQLAKPLRTRKRVKPGVVSAVLTSNKATTESLVR